MASWIEISDESDFSLQNLPYGVFSTSSLDTRIGVAIGNYVLDLKALAQKGVFRTLDGFDSSCLQSSALNAYAGLGRPVHRRVREFLLELLGSESSTGHLLRDNKELQGQVLISMDQVQMHLPMAIGDYTDFFVGPHHSQNCSDIFRPGTGMPASFFAMPLGYHGRASSIVVSPSPVRRPRGQFMVNGQPSFGTSTKLDFEVEFAAFIGKGNGLGDSIDVNQAEEHLFGFVLLNDWSARDIQRMEATPLGPFNGKNFCTTISPWIVTPDALEAHRTMPYGEHKVLPYLQQTRLDSVYDITINVHLQGLNPNPQSTSTSASLATCNTSNVAFSFAQMLAHHTAGGCALRTGDLLATGTLSGPTRAELGCLLELTWDGTRRVVEGSSRQGFLEDGDVVSFTARAGGGVKGNEKGRVGFGVCKGWVVASV